MRLLARGAKKRHLLSAGTAMMAALSISASALAASWNPPIALSSADATAVDVATIDSMHAVAAFNEWGVYPAGGALYVRRTVNRGASWLSPQLIATHARLPVIDAYGNDVDLVWNSDNGRVRYAHSGNGGQSFSPSVALSPSGHYAWAPQVSRGPNGVVAVIYNDGGKVAVRVSTNGGAHFRSRHVLSRHGDDQSLAIAVGQGVIYAAYSTKYSKLHVKRSLDNGATWGGAALISSALWDGYFSMAADGSHAYLAYSVDTGTTQFFRLVYVRTLNNGSSWSSQMNLAPSSWTASDPDLGLANGKLRAVFTRCTPEWDVCSSERTFFRQTSNGTSWGKAQRVSPSTLWGAYDPAVGAHWPLVLYMGEDATGLPPYARSKL